MLHSKNPSSTKVKNPCKVCNQQVTNKTGIRCKGLCKQWAHFKCLGFSSEKISDLKKGLITVMCPCSACETTKYKECPENCVKTKPSETETAGNRVKRSVKPLDTFMHSSSPGNMTPTYYHTLKYCKSTEMPCGRVSPPPLSLPPCPPDIHGHVHRKKVTCYDPPIPHRVPSPEQKSKCTTKEKRSKKKAKKSSSLCIVKKRSNIWKCPGLLSSSDSCVDIRSTDVASLITALRDMCNTVESLLSQIKYMMCEIMD